MDKTFQWQESIVTMGDHSFLHVSAPEDLAVDKEMEEEDSNAEGLGPG